MDNIGIINHISQWLHEYATSAGMKGFVVGISGGIDSAVTSALCARTGLEVLCLDMPIHQHLDQVSRGAKHIEMLKRDFPGVRSQTIELTPVFDAFVEKLPEFPNREMHEFSLVNTRARFRMTTLYYFAGLHKYLVAGTGNKVEDFGVGFYTKYGDGGVDLSPIADLMKSEVYAVAEELGISEEIRSAPPTDGLWGDSRTDEDQIGASYPELEWAMTFAGNENSLTPRQTEVLAIYRRLNKLNQHKMLPIPVCEIPEGLRL
jgi:NAD+ synthase